MPGPDGGGRAVAYIGLGSNLGDREIQVKRALQAIVRIPGCTLLTRSSLYVTAPVGPLEQPDYVNAVVGISTGLTPAGLLAALQGIERAQGRVRDGTRWGPRILDLDILTYGDLVLDIPGLRLPHPEIPRRAFVLVPLAEIAPASLVIPGQGRLDELLAACLDGGGASGVRRMAGEEGGTGMADAQTPSSPRVGLGVPGERP